MRTFSLDYLRQTRRGMWSGDRSPLSGLGLGDSGSILDVGCGDGALTRVLIEESDGSTEVVGCDVDTELLSHSPVQAVRGDAYSLPFSPGAFELVACQALLVNLGEPERAVEEFVRVSSGRVGFIEPDNSEVTVESTVDGEASVARRTRSLYIEGLETDVSLGDGTVEILRESEPEEVTVDRYDHELSLGPPYDKKDVRAVRRKARGDPLRERRPEMAGTDEKLDSLREDWRAVGRKAARQMENGEYRRYETIPFYVVVGEV